MRVAVIGGGPAGFFASLFCSFAFKELKQESSVDLFERNVSLGKKLLLSGFGKCNLTNAQEPKELMTHYGKNGRFLKQSLYALDPFSTISLFEKLNLPLVIEDNQRVFPATFKSSSVLEVIIKQLYRHNVNIHLNRRLESIKSENGQFSLSFENGENLIFDKVIIATGGVSYPQTGSSGDGYSLAKTFGHNIVALHPALAPLKVLQSRITECRGITVSEVALFSKENPPVMGSLLITDVGFSGPAALNYSRYVTQPTPLSICWVITEEGKKATVEAVIEQLKLLISENPAKSILKIAGFLKIPNRLIRFLIEESNLPLDKKGSEINKRELHRLAINLTNYQVEVTTEGMQNKAMATGGGVSLKEINPKTMESLLVKNLYFAGEVLDIDGDSGGYNIQAAFSTGSVAGLCCAETNPFTMIPKFITLKGDT
ncbi:MAG: NAD(P)/FAD-dependent oxidoreductase [Sphaerochaetaceae bacterium]